MTGPQIDNRISFGNIMVAVGMIVSVAMAWAYRIGQDNGWWPAPDGVSQMWRESHASQSSDARGPS